MIVRFPVSVALAIWVAGLAGCKQEPSPRRVVKTGGATEEKVELVTFPELGPSRLIQPGIKVQEATLRRGGLPMRVWFYQPEKAADKLALVLVPPAGSPLFLGVQMEDGDRAEHYPFVNAGFAVASFDIDGSVPAFQRATGAALLQGAREFRNAQAGLVNAKTALDFVLAKVPNIDAKRVYISGHSSAATLALLVAEHESRINACAAYAPITDVEQNVEAYLAKLMPSLEAAMPGYKEFLHFSSPRTHADKLKCPVFLFHAQDDETVPIRHSTDFAALVKRTNPDVTLVTTRGGHYDSMIREGIPRGIQWFLQRQKGDR